MRSLAVAAALLSLVACRTQDKEASDLNFAHYQAEDAYGGPLGRLEALRQGFPTNFTTLDVCVETGKANIADDEVVFEVRLAYAAWLNASGLYTEDDWQKFRFVGQTVCDRKDKTLAGFVSLLSSPSEGSADDLDAYQAEQITCTTNGSWKSCNGTGVTLGWGGPGGLSSWYFNSNPNRWTKVELARASATTLSPYIDWLPLTEDVKRSKLTDAQKQPLLDAYASLKALPSPTLAQLAGFISQMEAVQLTGADDPVFGQMAKQFYAANTTNMTQAYRGQMAAFSTILHEIGHQYGMDHAHHPGQDSVTGKSSKSTVNEAGQNVTDIASMAYGLRYDYLTDDDIAGIQSDASNVRQYMAGHK